MDIKTIILSISLILFFILESMFPHFKDRKIKKQSLHSLQNIILGFLNGIIIIIIFSSLYLNIFTWINKNAIGILNIVKLPWYFKVIFGIIIFDIWMYTWHLLNHNNSLLWKFHRVHHTDNKMDASSAIRFHTGEILLSAGLRIPIFIIIGIHPAILIIHGALLNFLTIFHHSNIALPDRIDKILRMLIVTPNMHRVHHSQTREETDSNYSSMLSIWDRIFKTYKKIEDTKKIKLGLIEFMDIKYQYLPGMIITPFIRLK